DARAGRFSTLDDDRRAQRERDPTEWRRHLHAVPGGETPCGGGRDPARRDPHPHDRQGRGTRELYHTVLRLVPWPAWSVRHHDQVLAARMGLEQAAYGTHPAACRRASCHRHPEAAHRLRRDLRIAVPAERDPGPELRMHTY